MDRVNKILLSVFVIAVLVLALAYVHTTQKTIDEATSQIDKQKQVIKSLDKDLTGTRSDLDNVRIENADLSSGLEKVMSDLEIISKKNDDLLKDNKKKDKEISRLEARKKQKEEAAKLAAANKKQATHVAQTSKKHTVSAPATKTLTMNASAYVADCDTGCSGITKTGINLLNNRHAKVVAVDPSVIPLGTHVWVEGYGNAIAADTGGAIKGHKIDLHVPTTAEAFEFGRRSVQVKILN